MTSPSQVPVERLKLTVMRRIDGLLAGDHAGLFPGHGTESGEARVYVPGDDTRHIDWAVTARTSELQVRDNIADHELDVWLVLDTSSSLGFGTARTTKHEVAWSVAGAFALLASSGGNRVGAVRSTPASNKSKPQLFPSRGGSRHVGAILAGLHTPPIDGEEGDLATAIEMVGRASNRRGMLVVVSDFLGPATWDRAMRAASHRHDVIAVEVVDPREVELPDVGLIAVVDPETGRRRLVDTSDAGVRDRYAEGATLRRSQLVTRLNKCGADRLTVWTDRDWAIDFVRFVSARKSRVAAAGRR